MALLPPVVATLVANTAEFTAKMDKASEKMSQTSDAGTKSMGGLAKVGKVALAGVATGAVTIGAASIKMAATFQDSMTQLVTGAGMPEAAIGKVRTGILAMSSQVGVSANDLAKSMFTISSAGYKGADGLNVLHASSELARIGNADASVTADALTSALNAYRLPASAAVAVSDQLNAAVASGKMHMQDLASSLGAVLPAAAAAHLSLAEVTGAIATMTSQGTPAADAATYLRSTILTLENPTKAATTEMASLGLSSIEVSQNLGKRGLTGTMDVLTSAITSHMGPSGLVLADTLAKVKKATVTLDQVMGQLGPAQQSLVTGFMSGAVTAKSFHKALAAMPPTQQVVVSQAVSLDKAQSKVKATLATSGPVYQTYVAALAKMTGGTKGMQAALELTGSNAGAFKANVSAVADAAQHAGKDVTGWAAATKDFSFKMASAKATVTKIGIEIGTVLIPIVEKAIAVVQKITDFFVKHKVVAIALAVVIGGVLTLAIGAYLVRLAMAAVSSAVSFARMAASTTFWAIDSAAKWVSQIPAMARVMAAKAAAAGETVVFDARMLASTARYAAMSVLAWLKQIPAMAKVVIAKAATAVEWIASNLAMIASSIAAAAAFVIAYAPIILGLALIAAAAYLLVKHWRQVWEFIKSVTHAAVGVVVGLFHVFMAPIQPIIDIVSHFGDIWKSVWGGVQSVMSAVWSFIKPIFDAIGGAIGTVVSAFQGLGNAISSIPGAGAIGSAFGALGLASGGLVSQPTLAVIGEAGPEVVIPLSQLQPYGPGVAGLGGSSTGGAPTSAGGAAPQASVAVTVNVAGSVTAERDLAETVRQALVSARRNGLATGF